MTAPYPAIRQYIAGEWQEGQGDGYTTVLNPSSETPLAEVRHVSAAQLDRALEAVRETARPWRRTSPTERSAILRRAASLLRERCGDIARTLVLEQGKPLREAHAEVLVSADMLDWYAEEGRRAYGRVVPGEHGTRLSVIPEPIGPVAAFTPWNFPATSSVRKLGGALAAGCPIILKPSEETPGTVAELFRALADAGLPPGVAHMVLGDPAGVSAHLLADPVIRKLSLTGSAAVGRELSHLAVEANIVTTMELGGNAPVLIFPDVSVEAVAEACAKAKFRNAGQVCNVPSRFFVHESASAEFAEAFASIASGLRVGDGLASGVEMGPLANARRRDAVEAMVDEAAEQGARILAGGGRLEGPGFFFTPTVLGDVGERHRVFSDEVFGPVVPITTFRDEDEAVQRANDTDYGLGAFVFTESLATATRVSEDLEAGVVGVNTTVLSRVETPFGGVKASGHGQESGSEGLDAYLVRKAVLQHPPLTANITKGST
ncbi:NAD-dependent succinate-semialdehyde dehydrogenase [Streptomyces iranensis]|uniref:Succinate-semialdehyde dehydrogenase/glutarate-semialdehyde dehydrogenase n=1 Tax=Streptomyces iranensis TaxID=576784 RepID=A0ABS4N2B3_9ACTN|nr:NAD-dependent succinate-semialdehyde dehydrogenase [Streptomyces iranensis]MBP2066161.1 succinate-semialdehyde dehydrogenase/glutarate-semialdehyde dehydrogenase [Streptomyces iranensis]